MKFEDVNNVGGRNFKNCIFILMEGDFVKVFVVFGFVVVGCDEYGVFFFRGKFFNVCEVGYD